MDKKRIPDASFAAKRFSFIFFFIFQNSSTDDKSPRIYKNVYKTFKHKNKQKTTQMFYVLEHLKK